MIDGGNLTTTKETISTAAREQVFKCDPAPAGTMLMSFKLTIGKITRITIPAFHNEAIISIAPYIPDLSPYLFKILPRQARQGSTKAAIKGATLNRESLANILIPLPPLAEQRRIVSMLDNLAVLCNDLEAVQKERESQRDTLRIAALQQLATSDENGIDFHKQAMFFFDHLPRIITMSGHVVTIRRTILDLALKGRLVRQDSTGNPEMNSEDTTFGEVVTSLRYGTSAKCSYTVTPYPVLRIPNVVNGHIALDDMKYGQLSSREADNLRLTEGDILIVRSNGSLSLVGRPALVDASAAGTYYAGYLVRARPNLHRVVPGYLILALQSPNVREQIENPIRTTVGLKNINATELQRLHFRLPAIPEQRLIVAKVNALMTICDELEGALASAQVARVKLLDALLHDVLN
jgi:type I restriction enzyme, S subunit